ncbi:MAG: hypothetical protein NTV01_22075 [Bacteroidia bacterium]|nr:hypothetical protein [Bacteroidia bacterium]
MGWLSRSASIADFAEFANSISGSQATSIRRFQDRYGYPDEVWNFQSIKKDLDRNTIRQEIGFEKDS